MLIILKDLARLFPLTRKQKTTSRNPRSTVGTVTEIYDYLRLLFARIGEPHCPKCGKLIERQTVQQIVDHVLAMPQGTRFMVMAPLVRGRKGEHAKIMDQMRKAGYVRMFVDGEVRTLDEEIKLEKNKKHSLSVVIDRLAVRDGITQRLTDSVETALKLAEGLVEINVISTLSAAKRRCTAKILRAATAASACRKLSRACFRLTTLWVPARPVPALA